MSVSIRSSHPAAISAVRSPAVRVSNGVLPFGDADGSALAVSPTATVLPPGVSLRPRLPVVAAPPGFRSAVAVPPPPPPDSHDLYDLHDAAAITSVGGALTPPESLSPRARRPRLAPRCRRG